MASGDNTNSQDNDNGQGEIDWKIGKQLQYPPPADVPEYVKKALPPRPNPGSSFICSLLVESAEQQYISNNQHQRDRPDVNSGSLYEAELAVVQPLQLVASSSPCSEEDPEIVAPQPRYPARMILETSEADDIIISPVSGTLAGNKNLQQYEVSPISPNESACSLHSGVSSSASHNSSSAEETYLSRQPFFYEKHPIVYRSEDLLPTLDMDALNQKHQFQYQQINLRYSDPGSPMNGTVIHPPTSFPSDPNLRLSRYLDGESQGYPLTINTKPLSPADLANDLNQSQTPTETIVSPKVAFSSTINGFSTRSRANSKRTTNAPPPLKLSERPLADSYVKTPFPGVEPVQRQDSSGSTRQKQDPAEHKAKEEQSGIARKRNRVSTLPAFVFAKSLRQSGGETREKEKTSSSPTVRSIFSRAKSLRIGRGLGLGLGLGLGGGSEEARKEKRKEEMKRQIRLGEPRS
ncbi:hypothetical protein F4813DRAFT_318438 [Daldinia decipiens]|uniref:uncharacterized protein n=1 Tax=Daldinia decipiens TaxID=326647 RepID=UPI0020C4AD2C|nr:uncharacterized protein F4813DRAFT_318438 [Daldinia decipiens]KAI1660261.1 hypothetical protein F4813DRAFT_318438 [Daldinia decipiens]